ncbi:MAG: hypothetical protein Q9169_008436, partial [Polycauliona sp. 2 TL-2023]
PYPTVPGGNPFATNATVEIEAGLRTFVTSKLMQLSGYYAVPMDVVDRTAFESVSAANEGNYYYWSPSTRRMYEMRDKGRAPIGLKELGVHFTAVVDRWADPQLLFDGGYNCTAAGNAGAAIVNEKPDDGGIDVSCVSQLPMSLPSFHTGGR